jgi:hypothetical protein
MADMPCGIKISVACCWLLLERRLATDAVTLMTGATMVICSSCQDISDRVKYNCYDVDEDDSDKVIPVGCDWKDDKKVIHSNVTSPNYASYSVEMGSR